MLTGEIVSTMFYRLILILSVLTLLLYLVNGQYYWFWYQLLVTVLFLGFRYKDMQ